MKHEFGNNGNSKELMDILSKNDMVKVNIIHKNTSYEIPLNYGYELDNDNLILYCDFSNEIRKLDILKDNPKIAIEINTEDNLYQLKINSNITIDFIDNIYDKIRGLNIIDKHSFTKKQFKNKAINNITLIKITCDNFIKNNN